MKSKDLHVCSLSKFNRVAWSRIARCICQDDIVYKYHFVLYIHVVQDKSDPSSTKSIKTLKSRLGALLCRNEVESFLNDVILTFLKNYRKRQD